MAWLLALVLLLMGSVSAPLFGESVTVATVNVWSGLKYSGFFTAGEYEADAAREFRYELLSEELARLSPDVIGLNEANPLPDYAQRLGLDLDYTQVNGWRRAGVRIGSVGLPVNLREGDVLLARPELELSKNGSSSLSGGPAGSVVAFQLSDATQVLAGKVTVGGRRVHLFVTRLHPSPFATPEKLDRITEAYSSGELPGTRMVEKLRRAVDGANRRSREVENLLVYINRKAGKEPAILMGSLNALPGSDEVARIREAGFVDSYAAANPDSPGFTWDSQRNGIADRYRPAPWEPGRYRVDYIFVRGDAISVQDARVFLDDPTYGVYASDHFGVLATLEIAEPAE
jgi:endonuclease/exonuclease/phosphatase family metal-dependent hydrolase